MDLLVTQGMWYASVRLAYQLAIATSQSKMHLMDKKPATADAPNTAPLISKTLDTWAEIFERVFTVELRDLERTDSGEINPMALKSSSSLRQTLSQALKKS